MRKSLLFSITALGISAVVTQLIVIREFFSAFYGNELVFGMVLANWMFLTGTGAYIGRYSFRERRRLVILSQIGIAVMPIFQIAAIHLLRVIVFPGGEMISIAAMFWSSLLLLAPYCILSGLMFTSFCIIWKKKESSSSIRRIYLAESIGNMAGGAIFSLILIRFLDPGMTAYLLMLLNLTAAFIMSKASRKRMLQAVILIALILIQAAVFLGPGISRVTPGTGEADLIFMKDSPYGRITLIKDEGQESLFENNALLFSTGDNTTAEEAAHYCLLQRKRPEHILIISAGNPATVKEALKHNITGIDYIVMDPVIIEAVNLSGAWLNDSRINIVTGDARLFVRQQDQRMNDAAIIDLPDPDNAAINRFYTTEFFAELKSRLKEGGIACLSLSASENYLSEEIIMLNSAVYASLKKNFRNVLVVPGARNYLIASDASLNSNISELLEQSKIKADYVNKDYIRGILTKERMDYAQSSITSPSGEKARENRDLAPIAYYYGLRYWISHFRPGLALLILALAAMAATAFRKITPVSFAIFTTGFTGASLEVIMLIGFQATYGYAYYNIGIIITSFYAGLAAGSFLARKIKKSRRASWFIRLEYAIALFSLLLPAALIALSRTGKMPYIIPALSFLLAMIAGMEFPLASGISFRNRGRTAAQLYHADMIGAGIGSLLAAAILVPILGITLACVIVSLPNIVSIIFLLQRRLQ